MGSLSIFLAGNAEKRKNRKVAVSDRFRDENGPVEWEIRSISADEDEALRRACTKQTQVPGKKGQFSQTFDANAYLAKLAAASVVFPDLNNAELQNSYGAMGAEQLVKAMLYRDEFDRLSDALMDASELADINMLVEDAKN